MIVAGWRDVPVDENVLGVLSKDFVPTIRQVNSLFLRDPDQHFLFSHSLHAHDRAPAQSTFELMM